MKKLFRIIFFPLLNLFESGTEEYIYKPSHRGILIFIGVVFSSLAAAVFYVILFVLKNQDFGYFLPVLIFGAVGVTTLAVGFLGSDRAVSKIWGAR